MALRIYNTLTRQKEEFRPVREGHVGIYFCGMTVQDRPHVGHMRAFITGDVVRRYLEFKGYDVFYLTNFTDIDDKIIMKSREQGVDWRILAERNIDEFFRAAELMNLKPATHYPRATKHIQEIIEMVESIIANGFAYESNGNVYFEVSKFEGYGKLSGKKLEDLVAGARVEPDPNKRNPADFALWKAHKPGEPYWHSPWGKGRPGWHIECSAMSTHYLGQPFDIHGGGTDLIFPHHENEIAQAEAARGVKFVNFWIHNEMLNLKGEKMSKSTGLFFAITDVLEHFEPNAVRLYLLKSHYRSPIDYSEERLKEAQNAWSNFAEFFSKIPADLPEIDLNDPSLARWVRAFETAMDDDFSTPKALAVAFELLGEANRLFASGDKSFGAYAALLKMLLNVLGFKVETGAKALDKFVDDLLELIIEVRSELRKEKRYDLADKIRDRLGALGILLEDTPKGTVWKLSSSL